MDSPTLVELIAVLEDAVMADPGDIQPKALMADIGGWDSSSAVYFVGEALGLWGSEPAAEDMRACVTVEDLWGVVHKSKP